VGVDPFTIANNCSDRYVHHYRAFKKKHEPDNPGPKSDFYKTMLARLLDDVIIAPNADGNYIAALDGAKIRATLDKDKQARRADVKAYEEAAFDLGVVMTSPLFAAYEEAALDDEGIDTSKASPRLDAYLRVIGRTSRLLNESRSGRALLQLWADGAATDPEHLINQVVLPQKTQPTHIFKSTRWGSKAIANLLMESPTTSTGSSSRPSST
jgi:hypothetical protein